MKTLIIVLTCMITSVFYPQSQEELELGNRINNIVLSAIPGLVGKDYFILDLRESNIYVISKIDNNYTYYDIKLQHLASDNRTVSTKVVSYKPALDKIFVNFVPKPGVKKYLSEYNRQDYDYSIPQKLYFTIYKNGVKTFDTYLPSYLDNNPIESPIDNEVLEFLYYYLVTNPDQL